MRVVKYFWIISLLGFLATDLFVYGDAPEILNLHFDANGTPDFALKKIHFFYYALTFGLVPNIVLILLGYAIPYLPKSLIFVPNKDNWLSKDNRKVFYWVGKNYLRGFGFVLNLFFICAVFGFYYLNSSNQFPLQWTFYLIAAMGIGWLFYAIPLFKKSPDEFA